MMVPIEVLTITRRLVFAGPRKGTVILTTICQRAKTSASEVAMLYELSNQRTLPFAPGEGFFKEALILTTPNFCWIYVYIHIYIHAHIASCVLWALAFYAFFTSRCILQLFGSDVALVA